MSRCEILSQAGVPDMPLGWFAAVVVATTIMIVLTRRRSQRNTIPSGIRRPTSERVRKAREFNRTEDELRDVIIELEQLARELNAQIDTKYRKLEAVIRHADERIAMLRELTGQADQTPPSHVRSGSPAVPGLDIVVGDDEVETAASPLPIASTRGIDKRRILDLAAQGEPPAQIAAATNRSLAEVELVLRLHSAQTAGPQGR